MAGGTRETKEHDGLHWTGHVRQCVDCKRPFRVSKETLTDYDLRDVMSCLECVMGVPVPAERAALVA